MSRRLRSSFLSYCAVALLATVAAASPTRAEFPEKPVRLIVPFAPGGGTDTVARSLGALMAKEFGQPVIIENKPGASTIIGSEVVAHSPPDGYTLLVATLAHAVNPSMQPKMPYDTDKAFAAVTLIGSSHNVLVVKPDSPFKTVKDILEAAKAKPANYSFASQGGGTSAHLAGEMLKNLAKVDLVHVPYRGAGPALTDLLGGQVDMMFATNAAVAGFIANKRLRPIAVSAPTGESKMPGVPTIEETVPGYVVDSWYALYAPAKTPRSVIDKVIAAARIAAKDAGFIKRANDEGITLRMSSPEELDTYVRADMARWKKIVVENKIVAD
ncbi:LacI family transcriptional regulator [Bosea sp. Tri-44]|uniref:tripartite tricarboxylate transporter substrate binding protein n=1 Tax=Bosea sp. Tri-44 TaxID=1972137 RepID=UPI00100E2EBE|nr:tripartite tricarboxylate transporter substrate binding protein [Bosea sp. Tri-44]RXT44381.1 LacI family transcriptional regulator [Bosea sp. Tri-44]